MKRFHRISWNIESTPAHLIGSVLLAFLVMLFINGFIGSMGGIPAFIAFAMVFYFLRGMVLSGNRISHQLAMDSGKEIRYMFTGYAVNYLLLWAVMKLVLLFSRISGWGNIDGLALGDYLTRIYGSTMLERWAYLFAGILMFAFVMSLFPLVVIRKMRSWILYFLADGVVFAAVCAVIAGICRLFTNEELAGRAVCVLDDMLLCNLPQKWQAVTYIWGILLLTIAVVWLAYQIAKKSYSPKPGTMEVDESGFFAPTEEERTAFFLKRKKQFMIRGTIAAICVFVCVLILGKVFFGERDSRPHYYKVAECLTEDAVFGPMRYGNEIYLPVDKELDFYETGEAVGYLGFKGEDCSSRFYELAVGNLLYKGPKWNDDYLQMYGADRNTYGSALGIEAGDEWKTDEVFLLWDEEWENESRYSKEITGYSVCEKEFIERLEEQFGAVTYDPGDFTDYDAYFTIRGYADMKEAFRGEGTPGHWVGCILVKEDKFYYGSYDNEITGEGKQELLDILGGN